MEICAGKKKFACLRHGMMEAYKRFWNIDEDQQDF